jgi:hypothetical protein
VGWFRRNRDMGDVDPVAWVADEDAAVSDAGAQGARRADRARAAGRTPVAAPAADTSGDPIAEPGPAGSGRENGPWDVTEVDSADEYIDLGGLWLPGRPGIELRLEVEEQTDRVIAATVQMGDSAVQLQAFAAPRTDGIWDEIRKEIAASVTRQGGTADEVPGPFGRELLAGVPSRSSDGRTTLQPARFAGVDGPRWFLRAVFHGEAAYQVDRATELEDLVRDVVVVRGTEAMAPRELLTLQLPRGAEPAPGPEPSAGLQRPVRGPEITEVR